MPEHGESGFGQRPHARKHDAADAAIRQIVLDEDFGTLPFVGTEEFLPEYVRLPTKDGDVVATIFPTKK